jgi:hypothetical protein
MTILKWLLIVLSVIFAGVFLQEAISHPFITPKWPYYVIAIGCALDIFYLYVSGRKGPSLKVASRLFRLVDLWLSAKEQELKLRVKPKD